MYVGYMCVCIFMCVYKCIYFLNATIKNNKFNFDIALLI